MTTKYSTRILSILFWGISIFSGFSQNARIQVVHNAANAPAVDVFVNATKILSNVAFRSASGFLNATAGIPLQVRIKPASASNDTSNPVFFRRYILEANKGYYLVANGNLAPGSMAPNPTGINTGFEITVIPDAKESADNSNNVELRIMHSATDAPAVDIKAQGVATLVNDAAFRDFTNYIPVPASNYTIQISPASGNPNLFAYAAPLTGLAGNTALVLASGYLNPAANLVNGQPGPSFGIYAFTTSGNAIALPTATSRVQVVHNCANAPAVDIFVNGAKGIPGLDFRKATPFIDLNAGVPLTVSIKGASASSDTSNPAFRKTYELTGGESYTLVATGLLTTTGYAANPEGRSVGFDITVMPGAKEVSSQTGSAELRVLHGATDAPKVDVRIQGGPVIVNNAGFRDFSGYLPAGNQNFNVEITDSTNAAVVATFLAPVSGFSDSALVVMASGFLSPENNQNGAAFGLLAVTPKGQAILLPVVTSVKKVNEIAEFQLYPNPSTGSFFTVSEDGFKAEKGFAISASGQKIALEKLSDGKNQQWSASLTMGLYQIQLVGENGTVKTGRILID